MFVVESCKFCPACETVTPHSRRRFSLAWPIAAVLAIGGGWMLFRSIPELVLGLFLLLLALTLMLLDRDRFRGIECERCRHRAVVELHKTKPDLSQNTEINIL